MTINKFQGKTENEAIEKAKTEMGQDAVIMNVKVVKPKGVLRAFKTVTYEVTAALEEKEDAQPQNVFKKPESINLTADEQIKIPLAAKPPVKAEVKKPDPPKAQGVERAPERQAQNAPALSSASGTLEERLNSLQSLLEDRISEEKRLQEQSLEDTEQSRNQEGFSFVKMLYQTLLDNEVDEKYANQLLDELEKVSSKGSSIDYILSHIYQKLILKFGQPKPIELDNSAAGPKVVFFIGPTGVGKTTTVAKIASRYKVDEGKKVAFLTADTYRIAAAEQLRTYAGILDMPLTIVYSPEEVKETVDKLQDYDLILVDTAGFSHRNEEQREDVKKLIGAITDDYQTEVFLVLSATTKYRDLKEMCDVYKQAVDYKLIFTKLDETSCYGNLLNIHLYSGAGLSYATYGQNVPDDIEIFDTQKVVKKLLGGD